MNCESKLSKNSKIFIIYVELKFKLLKFIAFVANNEVLGFIESYSFELLRLYKGKR